MQFNMVFCLKSRKDNLKAKKSRNEIRLFYYYVFWSIKIYCRLLYPAKCPRAGNMDFID